MNIFKQIKNSICNKEYYKSIVLVESFRSSIKYLAKLSLLVSLVLIIIVGIKTPSFINSIKEVVSTSIATYPDDLVVSIKDGGASVNQPEPYYIKLPSSMASSEFQELNKIDNLVVINTTEPFTLDKFKESSTIIYLSKNELISMGDKGEIRIFPLSKLGNIEISKSLILKMQASLYKMVPWLIVGFMIIGFIVIYIVQMIGALLSLFIYALFVWLVLKTKNIKVSYARSYQVAIHTTTILAATTILGIFAKNLDNLPVRLLLVAFIVYINFDSLAKIETREATVIEVKPEELKN